MAILRECSGSVYSVVYQFFLSAIDCLDYHPSMHADDNPEVPGKETPRDLGAMHDRPVKTRQYSDLSTAESEYLSKLMAAIEKINKKLHHILAS